MMLGNYYWFLILFIFTACTRNIVSHNIIAKTQNQSEIYPNRNSNKVSPTGRYKRFSGLTAVADIAMTDHEFFKELYNELNKIPEIKKYYALLPVESYHMTTNNLYVKSSFENKWKEFLGKKLDWFKKFHKALKIEDIRPQIKLAYINVENTMGIIVTPSAASVEKIYAFGRKFNVENKIPKPFHITLAYLYKDITVSNKIQIKYKADEVFKKLIKKYRYQDKEITLSPASLRYFNTMKNFTPWDGGSLYFLSVN
jgi:hypothetical protein